MVWNNFEKKNADFLNYFFYIGMSVRTLASNGFIAGTLGTRQLTKELQDAVETIYTSRSKRGFVATKQQIQNAIGNVYTALITPEDRDYEDLSGRLEAASNNISKLDDKNIRLLSTSKGLTRTQFTNFLSEFRKRDDKIYQLSQNIFIGSDTDLRDAASTTKRAYNTLLGSGRTEQEVIKILENAKAEEVTKIANGDLVDKGVQALLALLKL